MSLNKQNFFLLLVYSFALIFIIHFSNNLIDFDKLMYKYLIENLNENQVTKYFKIKKLAENFNFLSFPILIFLKVTLITSIINIGFFFFLKQKTNFAELWNLVMKAEFVFLLVPVCKVVWFYFFAQSYTLVDLQKFFPFSAMNLIDVTSIEPWFVYPLQVLNLFELSYIIILSYKIGFFSKTTPDAGFKIVVFSYLPALVLWVTVITFLILNNS